MKLHNMNKQKVLMISVLCFAFAFTATAAFAALTMNATGVTGSTTLDLTGAAGSAITIGDAAQTGAISVGASTGALTLNLGTGASGVKTIHIGDAATANVITIGGGSTSTLAINTGDWDISATGVMTGIGNITTDGTLTLADTSTIASAVVVGTGSSDILTSMQLTPKASVTDGSASLRHVLVSVGDVSGTTAFGFGDPAVSNTGLMASFGRTVASTTGSLTDTGFDARMINNVDNDPTTLYTMQGAYIKAKNYSSGKVDVLKGLFVEAVNDGTVNSSSHVLWLGTDGTTLTDVINMSQAKAAYGIDMNSATIGTDDIRLHNGNTINNPASNVVSITGALVSNKKVAIVPTDASTDVGTNISGGVLIATKASATQTFVLPAATNAGATYTFVAGSAAGEILINPAGTDTISIKTSASGTSVVTASSTGIKNTADTNVVNDTITLVADGVSQWYMISQSGIWASQ